MCIRDRCKGDHPGVLRYLGTHPYVLSCSKTNKQYPLQLEHGLWQVKKTHGTCLNEAEHHTVLFKQLAKHSADWRNIGRGLGFIPSDLDIIQTNPALFDNAPSSWLEAMLAQWLRSGGRLETPKKCTFGSRTGTNG